MIKELFEKIKVKDDQIAELRVVANSVIDASDPSMLTFDPKRHRKMQSENKGAFKGIIHKTPK